MGARLLDLACRIYSPLIMAILILSFASSAANASFFNLLRLQILMQHTRADLRVEALTLDKNEARVGDNLSATVAVSNDGAGGATSTLLTLWIAAGSAASMSNASRLSTAQIGTVPPKTRLTYVQVFQVPNASQAGSHRVFATVGTSAQESNLGNNTSATTFQVVASPPSQTDPTPPATPPPSQSDPTPPTATIPSPTPVPAPSPGLKYKAYLDGVLASNGATFDAQARSVVVATCGGCIAFQYIVDGVTAMGEATKDAAYIARALGWAETIIATATITDSGGYQNWPGGWASPYSPTPIAFQLDDFLLAPALARVARVILLDSGLATTYGGRARAVYNFVNRNVADKWLVGRGGEGALLDLASNVNANPRMSGRIPLLGLMLMDLVAVSQNARYSNALRTIAAAYTTRLKPVGSDGALWLDVGAPCLDGDSCDTAHGGPHVDFITRAYEEGLGVTLGQLQGVATLLSKVLWNGSTSNPMFTNYTDGSNSTFRGRGPWSNGVIYTGWQTLARVDTTAKTIVSAVLDSIIAGGHNPSLDAMNTVYGQVELAGHLTQAGM